MEISDLELPDGLADHIHPRATLVEIWEVFSDEPMFLRNRGGVPTSRLMVGRTLGGRLLTVPITRRGPGLWRARTAYPAKPRERTLYERG